MIVIFLLVLLCIYFWQNVFILKWRLAVLWLLSIYSLLSLLISVKNLIKLCRLLFESKILYFSLVFFLYLSLDNLLQYTLVFLSTLFFKAIQNLLIIFEICFWLENLDCVLQLEITKKIHDQTKTLYHVLITLPFM